MTITGNLEYILPREIAGWAADTDAIDTSMIVEAIAEGEVIASGPASLHRDDLRAELGEI